MNIYRNPKSKGNPKLASVCISPILGSALFRTRFKPRRVDDDAIVAVSKATHGERTGLQFGVETVVDERFRKWWVMPMERRSPLTSYLLLLKRRFLQDFFFYWSVVNLGLSFFCWPIRIVFGLFLNSCKKCQTYTKIGETHK